MLCREEESGLHFSRVELGQRSWPFSSGLSKQAGCEAGAGSGISSVCPGSAAAAAACIDYTFLGSIVNIV